MLGTELNNSTKTMLNSCTDIAQPITDISCQDLLKRGVVRHGWLRRRNVLHECGDKLGRLTHMTSLAHLIKWQRSYVVLHNGCVYVFNNETSTRPEKSTSLFGYLQVMRSPEMASKEVPWPFKILRTLDSKRKVQHFGASSEEDLKKWMKIFREQMCVVHNRQFCFVESDELDYTDFERPIEFSANSPQSKSAPNVDEEDSDGDDYTSIPEVDADEDDHVSPCATGAVAAKHRPLPAPPSEASTMPRLPGATASVAPTMNRTPRSTPTTPTATAAPLLTRKTSDASGLSGKPHTGVTTAKVQPLPRRPHEPVCTAVSSPPATSPPANNTASRPKLPTPDDVGKRPRPPPIAKKPIMKETTPMYTPPEVYYAPECIRSLADAAMWTGNPDEGQSVMKSITEEGVFMIRPSTDGGGETLQVFTEGSLRKYKLTKTDTQYTLAGVTFDTLDGLLKFYMDNDLPNKTNSRKLTKPFCDVTD